MTRIIDRSKFGSGPWDNEPDKKQWVDQATGLPCLIVRVRMGHLCGYVGVPHGHPAHGKDYDSLDVQVHGELTFCGPNSKYEASKTDRDNYYFLGFDCAHAGDLCPELDYLYQNVPSMYMLPRDGEYRTIEYVEAECASLALQLSQMSQ